MQAISQRPAGARHRDRRDPRAPAPAGRCASGSQAIARGVVQRLRREDGGLPAEPVLAERQHARRSAPPLHRRRPQQVVEPAQRPGGEVAHRARARPRARRVARAPARRWRASAATARPKAPPWLRAPSTVSSAHTTMPTTLGAISSAIAATALMCRPSPSSAIATSSASTTPKARPARGRAAAGGRAGQAGRGPARCRRPGRPRAARCASRASPAVRGPWRARRRRAAACRPRDPSRPSVSSRSGSAMPSVRELIAASPTGATGAPAGVVDLRSRRENFQPGGLPAGAPRRAITHWWP